MLNKIMILCFALLFSLKDDKVKFSKEDFEGHWYCESQYSCLFIQKKGYSFFQPEQMYFKYKIKGDQFILICGRNERYHFKIKRVTDKEIFLVNIDFIDYWDRGGLVFKRVDECNSYYE